MTNTRKYNCKDVEMLMASRTIAENFRAKISELSALRPNWTEQYAGDLLARIDKSLSSSLGIDANKEMRLATLDLLSMLANAKRDVIFLRREIVTIFSKDRPRRDEILRQLGFTTFKDSLLKGQQEGMINLLGRIRENLSPALRNELASKGLNPALADRVVAYADSLSKANSLQETHKISRLTVTKGIADEFNDIFDEISGICRIASYYYQSDRATRAGFTFSKVLDNLSAGHKGNAAVVGVQATV